MAPPPPSENGPSGSDQAAGHIEVVNWDEYQHYTDRNPPWIKLYNSLLDDRDFMRLQPASRWLAVGLFLLASRTGNEVPLDHEFLQWRLKLPGRPNLQPLQDAGLIRVVHPDSGVLAGRNHDAIPEGEGETEEETEQITHTGDGRRERFPHPDDLPKEGGQYLYPDPFEAFWRVYPDRRGSNSKVGAYRKWRSLVLDGTDPSILFEAASKYRSHMEAEGQVGSRYVMQAKTFLGPDEHWRQAWDDQPEPEKEANRRAMENYRSTLEAITATT